MENGGNSSKELLRLEHNQPSSLEETLLVCGKKKKVSKEKDPPREKPVTCSVGHSQVLGRVKDFLGVISEANERQLKDAKDNAQDCDIEVLTGNESHVIEMDLMLGIADLNTPEAVAAAESAIDGNRPLSPFDAEAESESTSDDDDNDDEDDNNDDEDEEKEDDNRVYVDPKSCVEENRQMSSYSKDKTDSIDKDSSCKRLKKRPKIIEMS